MLKLLKYEWKACARTCLPLYGVLILMSLISRILYVIPKNASLDFMLPAISSMLYMGVIGYLVSGIFTNGYHHRFRSHWRERQRYDSSSRVMYMR